MAPVVGPDDNSGPTAAVLRPYGAGGTEQNGSARQHMHQQNGSARQHMHQHNFSKATYAST